MPPLNFKIIFLVFLVLNLILVFAVYFLNKSFSLNFYFSSFNNTSTSLDPLDDFLKLHEKNLESNNSNKIVYCNRVKPGYANRIYSILSCLTIAILTDSALSIDWPEVETYIDPPLKMFLN